MKLLHNDELNILPEIHGIFMQKSLISHIFVCQKLDDDRGEHEHLFE